MPDRMRTQVAIVDYGMGNLFSVQQACEKAGLSAVITSRQDDLLAATIVVLPGVGAFGVAMENLTRLDLVQCLREVAVSDKILVGVCLGMQLLMTESQEFGRHRGLGLIEGEVVRLPGVTEGPHRVRVPQVGWNRIQAPGSWSREGAMASTSAWTGTILEGLTDGEYMYFVHSYYCRPVERSVVLSITRYGETEFCSALRHRNIFACQFHPERSGLQGLRLYRNMAMLIKQSILEGQDV